MLETKIMNEHQPILAEITQLTSKLKTNYPELYRSLNENPMTIPSSAHPDIDCDSLKEYLDGLKQLLEHHLESHNT